jgi:hypothetical protein
VQKDWQEENDLAKAMPEKFKFMKAKLLTTWEDIKKDGPNEWWENESNKPMKGATLNY